MILRAIYRFNAIPIKIAMAFFHINRAKNSKISMELQKTLSSQSNLEKEHAESIMPPDFKLYYKATVIKTVWH